MIYSSLFAIICCLIAVPMWCLGLRTITDYPEQGAFAYQTPEELTKKAKLFWRVRKYTLEHYPILGKPIITCVSCMPSVHTLPVIIFVYVGLGCPFTLWIFPTYAFIAVASSFIAGYWWKKFKS